jgi:hypothetical protein
MSITDQLMALPGSIDLESALDQAIEQGGDVGPYWIGHVDAVLERYPTTKFVCLDRPHWDIFSSLVQNPVRPIQRMGMGTMTNINDSLKEEIDSYYDRAALLQSDSFRIFLADALLYDESVQQEMLDWLGLDRKVEVGIHLNKRSSQVHVPELIETSPWPP